MQSDVSKQTQEIVTQLINLIGNGTFNLRGAEIERVNAALERGKALVDALREQLLDVVDVSDSPINAGATLQHVPEENNNESEEG